MSFNLIRELFTQQPRLSIEQLTPIDKSNLSDRKIKTTPSTEKEFTLSDDDGLQLRIRPDGTKAWQFKFTNPIPIN